MNTIVTPNLIAKEALMQLKNNMVMGSRVHKEYKNEFVSAAGGKSGGTVSIRKPLRFEASDGATRVNQDVSESTIDFTINKRKHVSWKFSAQDLTLSIEEYSKRYITPAAIALANIVDSDLCNLYKDVFMASGTAGTTPSTYAGFGGAAKTLNKYSVPVENRSLVLDPESQLNAAGLLVGLYNPSMVEGAVRNMKIGPLAGFDVFMDQNIKSHTAGTGASYAVDGANQAGSSILVKTGTGTFVAGDIITLAGVNGVNPVSKASTGELQKFIVTAPYAGGAGTVSVYPSIITSGAYQTVSGSPADSAAITLIASHTANMAFHKNAFGLVMCPIELPDGAAFKHRETHDDISIRVVKDYDVDSDDDIIRLDILYGVKTIYPELACRLLG